jgi:hypothetical protein
MFQHVKVGEVVVRLLAGTIPMKLMVTEVTDKLIITGGGWEFDRVTGAEVDDLLHWGPPPLMTGSYLELEETVR